MTTQPQHIEQGELCFDADLLKPVRELIRKLFVAEQMPSAWKLLEALDHNLGLKARWYLNAVLEEISIDKAVTQALRSYCRSLRESEDLVAALRGVDAPKKEISSSIDSLLQQSKAYGGSREFQDMVSFMAQFREYAPYNNMLVRLQDPTCSFYATASDWQERFGRHLKEDARPMLILAPMRPVMLVFALDQTDGLPLPKELSDFANFQGEWKSEWLHRIVENAATRDKIRVNFKTLSSTNAGFATIAFGNADWKMRIAVHEHLDEPSRFGVVCHELAHIYLGHLGSDGDHWWPSRTNLSHRTIEVEAEATAFIVTSRFGLKGASARYVSRHLGNNPMPESVSLDLVAKVASRIEKMANEILARRREPTGLPRNNAANIEREDHSAPK